MNYSVKNFTVKEIGEYIDDIRDICREAQEDPNNFEIEVTDEPQKEDFPVAEAEEKAEDMIEGLFPNFPDNAEGVDEILIQTEEVRKK